MGKRKMVAAVTLATAAVVIPVTLALAGNASFVKGDVASQSVVWTKHGHQAPKDWKRVPEVGFLSNSFGAHSITVSAEMKKGKAKFRVVSQGATTPPGPIAFYSKAANSFTFGYPEGCYFHPTNSLEWKRIGNAKATASTISVLDINGAQPCL